MSAPAVTVAPGVTITAEMTPTERYNAIAKSQGVPTVERPVSAPQWHTDATVQRMAQGDQAQQAKPGEQPHTGRVAPTPQALEAGNVEAFDAEMRAKGAQLPVPVEDGRFVRDEHTDVVFDSQAIAQCHKLFRDMKPEERTSEARQEYQETLRDIYAGKLQLSDMEGTNAPRVEQPRDSSGKFAPAPQPGAVAGWQSHIEDGQWVGLEHLTLADTSGYTVPRYVADQRLHTSTFDLLRQAKAAGITQAQVDEVFRQQAVGHGWTKA